MVATADSLAKGRNRLNSREEQFCRIVAQGATQAAAYRMAYGCRSANQTTLWVGASKVANKPCVRARLDELRKAADDGCVMVMRQRRWQLAQTALDPRDSGAPSHAERIAAIREDAILAGERNEQSTVTADVSILAVMRAISTVGGEANAAAIDIATLEPQGGALGAPPPLSPSPPVSEAAGPIAAPMAGHAAPLCSVDLDLEDE